MKSKNISVYLFLIVPLIIYIIIFVIPNVKVIVYSFYNWNGLDTNMEFVGLNNYLRLLKDSIFWYAFINTFKYVFSLVIVQNSIGLLIAILIYKKSKTNILFRTLIFLPAMFSSVAVGLIWNYIYDSNIGLLNYILEVLGLESFQKFWLMDSSIAIFTVVSVHIWIGVGYATILFIAGLHNIPIAIYDSAKVDGVNMFQNFVHITIPLLKRTIVLVIIITLIGGFVSFDFVYVMTKGGPDHSSEVLATYLYKQGFEFLNVGYSSAIAIVLVLFVLIFSVIQLKAVREF